MKWIDGAVSVEDSVAAAPVGGEVLRERYFAEIPALTLGLIRPRGTSLRLGPVELLRFGRPVVTKSAVEWPIEGGWLAASPGGRWRIEAEDGRLTATADGYRPMLPKTIYALTQLQIHHLITRLFLLRIRGEEPAPGKRAVAAERFQAAAVDVAFVLTLARLFGRRPKLVLGLMAGYHAACWSVSGQTLGGMVMKQRVVALDGSRVSPLQAVVRLTTLPLSWVLRRPVHDEFAGTEVIRDKSKGAADAAP